MLVNIALDSNKPDIMRQNAMEFLRHYRELSLTPVKVDLASHVQKRIAKKPIDLTTAKVSNAAGIMPYLKQKQVEEFFYVFHSRFEQVGHHWTNHSQHTKLLEDFEDVGHFLACSPSVIPRIVLWMLLCFLGEPGGYGIGTNRPVFYSNSAAPKIKRLFKRHGEALLPAFDEVLKDKRVQAAIKDKHINRRKERLLDYLTESDAPKTG